MPTPFEDLNTATQAIMALVDAASSLSVLQAPTNFGTDFRITPGAVLFQVEIEPRDDAHRANLRYPRAEVAVLLHCYIDSLATENTFAHETMSFVADEFFPASKWAAQAGVFSIDPEAEPESTNEGRDGNVVSFIAVNTVWMDPA